MCVELCGLVVVTVTQDCCMGMACDTYTFQFRNANIPRGPIGGRLEEIAVQTFYRISTEHSVPAPSQLDPMSNHSLSVQGKGVEDVLLEAVERGLHLLGESAAQVIFYNLDTRYSLSKPEIPRKPERFVKALGDMFGDGAETIEKLVVRAVCTKFGLHPDLRRRFSFSECIREVKHIQRTTEGKAERNKSP
jgi:hypothetical protein